MSHFANSKSFRLTIRNVNSATALLIINIPAGFRLTIRNVNIAMVATLGWYIQSFRLTIRNVNKSSEIYVSLFKNVLD